MKLFTITATFLLFFTIVSFGQDLKKLTGEDIDSHQKEIAQKFATAYFTQYNSDKVYIFSNEATDELKNVLTPAFQTNFNKNTMVQFGKFKQLELTQVWLQSGYSIFRFKADFEKAQSNLEIRIVLNSQNLIAGFFLKPWADSLY